MCTMCLHVCVTYSCGRSTFRALCVSVLLCVAHSDFVSGDQKVCEAHEAQCLMDEEDILFGYVSSSVYTRVHRNVCIYN